MSSRIFDGKIAFVTGATSGIGQSVAVAFAQEGATVVGCGRNAAGGADTEPGKARRHLARVGHLGNEAQTATQ